ncbi:MAG TPA: DNA recombination protein RmuC [Opitutaceae bacterium]|nr:DNA recombination protein RmuC [Opitutaceae bacterium]
MTLLCIVLFLAGFGIGCLALWSRRGALDERLRSAATDNARLAGELAAEKTLIAELSARNSSLNADLAAEKAASEARMTELRSANERLKAEFAELSVAALRTNSDAFLKLAEQSFAQLHEKSAGDLTTRQQAIDLLVKPLKESLEKVDKKIGELEQKRERAYGELGQQLEALNTTQLRMHSETTKLSTALSTTRTAGTWGEVQLRRVVELAGMMEHCDFSEQTSFTDSSGKIGRPDLVVSLPGGQRIAIDAKAPTEAFREAAVEADPARRLEKLREHASKVRGHIEALANRDYWAQIQPSPEYVVLFLPGDSFMSAAIESDPSIMDRAINRRVLLATPMTLVALLKAAAYGWRQEAVSRSAEEVSKLGRELNDRLSTFAEHMGSAARGLSSAVSNFNKAVGSFEGSVTPGARKFAELGAKGAKELTEIPIVDLEVRDIIRKG